MPLTPLQVERLCQQLIDCEDEAIARRLSAELRSGTHDLIQSLRFNLPTPELPGAEIGEREAKFLRERAISARAAIPDAPGQIRE